jgi:hypothetical protein
MVISAQVTTKKQCPLCYSKDVEFTGSKGSDCKFANDGGLLQPTEYYEFICNDCGIKFKYYGQL